MNDDVKCDIPSLLRAPGEFGELVRGTGAYTRLVAFLVLLTLLGAALFGLALGSFVNWRVACLDAFKMMIVVSFPFVLCIPTLCVFACICGCRLSFGRMLAFGLVSTATLGCLLAALAPILWLFAVSTEAVGFVICFSIVLAVVAAGFALRPIHCSVEKGLATSQIGFNVWFIIFLITALQTVTIVRPLLSVPAEQDGSRGKCFFVTHFFRSVAETGTNETETNETETNETGTNETETNETGK